MPPDRPDISEKSALPFSNPNFGQTSHIKGAHNYDGPEPDSSDLFTLTCLGVAGLLILSLITQADIRLSGPIFGVFLLSVLTYSVIKRRKAERASDAQNIAAPQREALYVSAAQIIDLMPIAAALIDKRNRVSHANPLAQDLIGIQNANRPLTHYIRDPKLGAHLERALAGYQPDPFLTKIDTPSERHIRLLFSQAQSLEDGSSQSLTLVIFDDVTDMQLNQQLRADFLANASHELKTPIASLMGYIETLQTHAKDDAKARTKFLGIMYSQAERMERLISDLLSLRQIEQVAHIVPTGTADMNAAVLAAIDSVTPISEKYGVTINYDNSAADTQFRGKEDEAVQMCLNIISNAVKISSKGSAVNIRLEPLTDWNVARAFENTQLGPDAHQRQIIAAAPSPLPCLRLIISDSGPGFERQHIPRIGERFYRVAGDLSSQEKGTGLGLAIVKHIVKRHRGGLYVRSEAGKGTEFSIVMMRNKDNINMDAGSKI